MHCVFQVRNILAVLEWPFYCNISLYNYSNFFDEIMQTVFYFARVNLGHFDGSQCIVTVHTYILFVCETLAIPFNMYTVLITFYKQIVCLTEE